MNREYYFIIIFYNHVYKRKNALEQNTILIVSDSNPEEAGKYISTMKYHCLKTVNNLKVFIFNIFTVTEGHHVSKMSQMML